MGYTQSMVVIRRTDEFDTWLARLRDAQDRQRILERVTRLSFGNPGDVKSVGDGVSELRVLTVPDTACTSPSEAS